jgi:hypothetical protein
VRSRSEAGAFLLRPRAPRFALRGADQIDVVCDDETSGGTATTLLATDLLFDESSFTVVLGDGPSLKVPLWCFPRLAARTPEGRCAFRISASGARLCIGMPSTKTSVSRVTLRTTGRESGANLSWHLTRHVPDTRGARPISTVPFSTLLLESRRWL